MVCDFEHTRKKFAVVLDFVAISNRKFPNTSWITVNGCNSVRFFVFSSGGTFYICSVGVDFSY